MLASEVLIKNNDRIDTIDSTYDPRNDKTIMPFLEKGL
jgi:hypothetical protein